MVQYTIVKTVITQSSKAAPELTFEFMHHSEEEEKDNTRRVWKVFKRGLSEINRGFVKFGKD